MAASAGGETVMAPGNLVISAYVTCPDITKTVTPDLKLPGTGRLIHVDLAQGQNRRLGGSCLGQVDDVIGPVHNVICKSLTCASRCPDHMHQLRLLLQSLTATCYWQPVTCAVANRRSTLAARLQHHIVLYGAVLYCAVLFSTTGKAC